MRTAEPKLETYQRRLSEYDQWRAENRPALMAFAAGAGVSWPNCAYVARVMVSNSRNGQCDLTTSQLVAMTDLSPAVVKRALKALTDAGALVTVLPGRSAGCAGGAGRGAVRRLTMLGVAQPQPEPVPEPAAPERMAAHSERMAAHSQPNGGSSERPTLRFSFSPENPPAAPAAAADDSQSEPLGGVGVEDEHDELQPAAAAVVRLVQRHQPRAGCPDRKAFARPADWAIAMGHFLASQPQPQPAQSTAAPTAPPAAATALVQQPQGDLPPARMPSPTELHQVAVGAARHYAEHERRAGRAHNPEGLARHATKRHRDLLKELCTESNDWRSWVVYAEPALVGLALHFQHQDRRLNWSLAEQLSAQVTERQQPRAAAG